MKIHKYTHICKHTQDVYIPKSWGYLLYLNVKGGDLIWETFSERSRDRWEGTRDGGPGPCAPSSMPVSWD